MIATLIIENLPQEVKLIIARNVKETWYLTKILDIVNQKLGVSEACTVRTVEGGKNGFGVCDHGHWSDKCSLITGTKARKKFLEKKGFCFLCLKSSQVSRNCSKKKNCYDYKGIHNSAVCKNKSKHGKSKNKISNSDNKNETGETSKNCSLNLASILL